MNIQKVCRNALSMANKKLPTLLTIAGTTGMVASVVMGVEVTPKALKLIEQNDAKSAKEIVKCTWKVYIPTALMVLVSGACIIGANSINLGRNAAILGLYSATASDLKEYKKKVVNLIGDEKEKDISNSLAEQKPQSQLYIPKQEIYTGQGEHLCLDSISGRYFRSDANAILRAENEFNKQLTSYMYSSLNDFYFLVGLPSVALGEDVGWNVDDQLEIRLTSTLTPNNEPCIVVNYNLPKSGYKF